MCAGRVRLGLGGLTLAALLGGCAVNPPIDLSELQSSVTAPVVLDVPFFPQEEHQCGPAALATVLVAAGVRTSPTELTPQVYLPGRQGSLQAELTAAVRRHGRIPWVLPAAPSALAAELEARRPVLVLQNLRVPSWPAWHYAVVTGMAPSANIFLMNSGKKRGLEISAPEFLRTWDWAHRWALVVLKPGDIPASVEPQRFFRSIATFEAVAGEQSALPAWESAARNWPDDPAPRLAIGNSAYARGDLDIALQSYAEGLVLDPGDPVLANNLATVLGEIGCPRAGEAVLAPVVATLKDNSDWSESLARTLRELADRKGADPVTCASM